jgi:hypothetical protein
VVDALDLRRLPKVPLPTGQEDKILDRALWHFWVEITRRVEAPDLLLRAPPQVGGGVNVPAGEPTHARLTLPIHFPPWVSPNYRARYFAYRTDICVLLYKQWYPGVIFTVNANEMAVITKISYEFGRIADQEVFQLSIKRNGATLATWEDMKINGADPNPAKQFVFGGHFLPIPTHMIFDHHDAVAIEVQALGVQAADGTFPETSTDILSGTCSIVTQGFVSTTTDDRDGTPRPTDPGIALNNYGDAILDDYAKDLAVRMARHILGGMA